MVELRTRRKFSINLEQTEAGKQEIVGEPAASYAASLLFPSPKLLPKNIRLTTSKYLTKYSEDLNLNLSWL